MFYIWTWPESYKSVNPGKFMPLKRFGVTVGLASPLPFWPPAASFPAAGQESDGFDAECDGLPKVRL